MRAARAKLVPRSGRRFLRRASRRWRRYRSRLRRRETPHHSLRRGRSPGRRRGALVRSMMRVVFLPAMNAVDRTQKPQQAGGERADGRGQRFLEQGWITREGEEGQQINNLFCLIYSQTLQLKDSFPHSARPYSPPSSATIQSLSSDIPVTPSTPLPIKTHGSKFYVPFAAVASSHGAPSNDAVQVPDSHQAAPSRRTEPFPAEHTCAHHGI